MNIRLGYACISKTLDITSSHTITYTNYLKLSDNEKYKKLYDIVDKNLDNLEKILKYNLRNNIHFYRMSSSIFPLATHPSVDFDFLGIFRNRLGYIGNIINDNNMRVDIHLDQFCVLNSVNNEVICSTINIINFYKNMLDVMGIKSYMILHVGSNSFGKERSISRFINNFYMLDSDVRKFIILENDDKVFNIKDVLYICNKLGIPMVLDYHHYICNNDGECFYDYIDKIFSTWKNDTPKVHFSSPKSKKEFRSHHDFINPDDFMCFCDSVKSLKYNFDIMIEAKETDNALFRLVRELKYRNVVFIDDTTFEI